MFQNTMFRWPPQPSTVVGFGILAGSLCYLVTGDPVWAGIAAAVVKILVPDNSAAGDRVHAAIQLLAEAAGRPLPTHSQTMPVASGVRASDVGSFCGEPPTK